MDSGRPEGTSRLIGVRAIESPHGDFDCWLPNRGSRLKGVGLYLSNDMSLTLKYIYMQMALTTETKNTWYPEQDYSNMGIGGKITGVYWNRGLLLEKRCQIKSLWY